MANWQQGAQGGASSPRPPMPETPGHGRRALLPPGTPASEGGAASHRPPTRGARDKSGAMDLPGERQGASATSRGGSGVNNNVGSSEPRVTISRGSESWGRKLDFRLGTQTERLIFEADKPGSPPLEVGRRGSDADARGGAMVDHFPTRSGAGGGGAGGRQPAGGEGEAPGPSRRDQERGEGQRRLEHEPDPWGSRERGRDSRSERVPTSGRDFQRTQTLEPVTEGRGTARPRGQGNGGRSGGPGERGGGGGARPDGALDQRSPAMADDGEFDMSPPSHGSRSHSPGGSIGGGDSDQLSRLEKDNVGLRADNRELLADNEELRSQVKALTMALQEERHRVNRRG